MVWPIIRGKSYVGETGKSMKVGEMEVAQEDGWRKILVSYRQVRRRGAPAWSRVFPAGALAIGGFGRCRWRLQRTRRAI